MSCSATSSGWCVLNNNAKVQTHPVFISSTLLVIVLRRWRNTNSLLLANALLTGLAQISMLPLLFFISCCNIGEPFGVQFFHTTHWGHWPKDCVTTPLRCRHPHFKNHNLLCWATWNDEMYLDVTSVFLNVCICIFYSYVLCFSLPRWNVSKK